MQMKHENIVLNDTAYLETYFLWNSKEYNINKKRPVVLVIPGGGYAFTSDREAEPIALKFNSIGLHAAVLWYTSYDRVQNVPHQALIDAMQAIAWLRKHGDEEYIDLSNVIVCGFSAGGHLALSAASRWHQEWLNDATNTTPEQRKVDLCIDCYGATQFPVSKPGDKGFGGTENGLTSNERVFGSDQPDEEVVKAFDPVQYFNQKTTPPMFIWHTGEDQLVPVAQALEVACGLEKENIPFELHIYERGEHGLALSDRTTARKDSHINSHVKTWFDLCEEWLTPYIDRPENMYGECSKGVPAPHEDSPFNK